MGSSTEMTAHFASNQVGAADPAAQAIAVAEVNAIVHAVKAAVGYPTQKAAGKAPQMVAKSGSPQSSQVATEGPTPETTPETTPPLCKKAAPSKPQTGAGDSKKADKQRAKRRRQRVKKAKKLARIEAAYTKAPSCEPTTTLNNVKESPPKEKIATKGLEKTKVPTQKKAASKWIKPQPEAKVQDHAEEMFDFEVNQKDIPFIDDWENFVDDEDILSSNHSKAGPVFVEEIPICLTPKAQTSDDATDTAAAALQGKEDTPSLKEDTPSLKEETPSLKEEEQASSNPIAMSVDPLAQKDEALSMEQEEVPQSENGAVTLAISLPSAKIDVASLSLDMLLPEARWEDAEEYHSANDVVVETEDPAQDTSASLGEKDDGPDRTDGPGGSDGSDGSDDSDGSFHESHNSPDPEKPKKKVRFTFAGLSPFSPKEHKKLRRRKKSPSTARLLARGIKVVARKIKNKFRRGIRAVWMLGREEPEETLDKEPSRLRKWKTILCLLLS